MPDQGVSRTTSWRTGLGALLAAAAVLSGVALAPSAGAAPTSRPAATPASATAPSAHGIAKQISCSGFADIVTASSKKHVCSHGGDPAPAGAAVGKARALPPMTSAASAGSDYQTAAATNGIACHGDGVSGQRVQAVYARNADAPDRFASVSASISGTYAGQVESVFAASAAETGGTRHVRWVTGAGCTLSVLNVVLPAGTPTSFDATINAMDAMGYNAPDRKYLIWMDATALCGIATVFPDDQPGLANASVGTGWARIDSGCWGLNNHTVEAHELMHTLGSVENTSPHHTAYGHCTDGNELMCYADGAGTVVQSVCPASHANLFDCNHDDYFSATQPAPGNYLATHWNTATSPWLAVDGSVVADAIVMKYNALGAGASFLGALVGPETAPTSDGMVQQYANGSIYWSPATGAHEIHGGIRDRYLSIGGPAFLGYPTSDESATANGAGRYNTLEAGAIYWSPASGAYEVHGAIRGNWATNGAESGLLGFPVTNETATPVLFGRYNHFQGGSVYWSPASGAHEVHGAIRGAWAAFGWENGLLGFPVTDELVTPNGAGRLSRFQNGSIYWSPATSAMEVHGAIRDKWLALGAEDSVLGFPASNEQAASGGRYNHFLGGSIYWSPSTGAYEVHGAIRTIWASTGWEKGFLGYPVSDEFGVPGGRQTNFQNGALFWNAATGTVSVR
ncbi:MAG: hypothetical protein NVSMB13_00300 [Mycobacteriales bacterium]